MTRIIHKQAVQAHAVPQQIMEARGPFSRYEPEIEGLDAEPAFPLGATAQNEMHEVVMYECRNCGDVVRDYDTDDHVCADAAATAPE